MSLIVTKPRGADVAMDDAAPTPSLARLIQDANEVLIDALPYLDKELDNPAVRERVESMVDEEMERFEPRDYLGSLQPVPPVSFPEGSLLWTEMERLSKDPNSRLNGIDLSRYDPKAPEGSAAEDVEAWTQALKQAHVTLEHTNIRSGNADLLNQYGVNTWRAYNIGLEDTSNVQKKRLDMEKAKVTEINRKRQQMQLGIASKLQKLEDKYIMSVHKNMRIEAQCRTLEAEVEALEKRVGERESAAA